MEEGAQVFPLVLEEIQKAEKEGASAVIFYAFGDLGILDTLTKTIYFLFVLQLIMHEKNFANA